MKLRLAIIITIATGIVLSISIAFAAENPMQPAFNLTMPGRIQSQTESPQLMPVGLTSVFTPTQYVFLPLINRFQETSLWINPSNRQVSLDYFNHVYLASDGIPLGWTGDLASCMAGETSASFMDSVSLRINYFRSMAGVPGTIQLSEEYSRKAQQAALMMSANHQLSHSPPSSWLCYTKEGSQAAGNSNLFLGVNGPDAITGYMSDSGSNNYAVGHRRWILYPQTQWMGSGDIPTTGGYWSSNALWVFDDNMWGPRPQTRETFVAWPPPGYIPYPVIFKRWSFAYPGADFSQTMVKMSSGEESIPVDIQPVVDGFGENTLVWEPGLSLGLPPLSDTTYNVELSGVKVEGVPHDFSYQVIIFDPGIKTTMPDTLASGQLDKPPIRPDNR